MIIGYAVQERRTTRWFDEDAKPKGEPVVMPEHRARFIVKRWNKWYRDWDPVDLFSVGDDGEVRKVEEPCP